MFLTARILFLNEEDYIWWALKSVYEAVDAIVVVEGCIKEYGNVIGKVSPEGLSTDGSEDEIAQFMVDDDLDKKVIYHRIGFVENYGELANAALEFFPRETTHFLNIDADEVYKAEDVLKVKKLFEEFPGLCGVAVERLHFYLDFWTLKETRKMKQLEPTGGTMFRRFYPGEYYPEKGAEHNPQFKDKILTDYWLPWSSSDIQMGIDEAKREDLDGITLRQRMLPQYHYGWVREEKKMLERVIQTYRRIDAYSGRGEWVRKSDEELADFIQIYNPIWTGLIAGGEKSVKFRGEHPEIMKLHPFFEMYREDFGWEKN